SELGKGSVFTLWLPADRTEGEVPRGSETALISEFAGLEGVACVGQTLLCEVEPIIESFVTRLRAERIGHGSDGLLFSQLADHLGTYLADLGGVLLAVEASHGEPSALVSDGTDIQRFVAERHGAQRARLGWTAEMLHR